MIESSIQNPGSAFGCGLGRKLYLPILLRLYPTTTGGMLDGMGGFPIGGWGVIYGLSLTTMLNELSLNYHYRSMFYLFHNFQSSKSNRVILRGVFVFVHEL